MASTVNMYDAASAGVRFAKTGPDCWPSDCTAALPLSASAAVRGRHPAVEAEGSAVAVSEVEVVAVVVVFGTLAYQYHIATAIAIRMMRQPSLRKNPFIGRSVGVLCKWGEYPRTRRAR